jgi:hypothetical protein
MTNFLVCQFEVFTQNQTICLLSSLPEQAVVQVALGTKLFDFFHLME